MSIAPPDATSVHLRPGEDLLEIYRRTGAADDFERVVARYAALVYGECRRVTRDAHDAEDAAQLAFLALAIELRSGETIKRPAGWLQRVAKRQALKIVRSRGRRKRREDAARREEMLPTETLPIDPTARDATASLIREAIDALPEKHRLPLVLHYFGGMSLEAIAHELGMTRTAVGTRLHRARKLLGDRLGERGLTFDAGELSMIVGLLVPATVIASLSRAATTSVVGVTAGGSSMAIASGVSQLLVVSGGMGGVRPLAAAAAIALLVAGTGVAWVGPHTIVESIGKPNLDVRKWLNQLFEFKPNLSFSSDSQLTAFESRPLDASTDLHLASTGIGNAYPFEQASPVLVSPQRSAPAPVISAAPPAASHQISIWDHATFASVVPDQSRPLDVPPAKAPAALAQSVSDFVSAASIRATPSQLKITDSLIGNRQQPTLAVKAGDNLRTGKLTLDADRAGDGTLVQTGGVVDADRFVVGDRGHGEYDLRDGRLDAGGVTIAAQTNSSGSFSVGGGGGANIGAGGMTVGDRGYGKLVLGNSTQAGLIKMPNGPLVVRANERAQGVVQGWGQVASHGTLVNNGKIIADGYGQQRSLDLTQFSSVVNTIDNKPDGTNGWYAKDGGRVELPALPVKAGTSTVTWGESAKDDKIDLVNSLRATIHNQPTPTQLSFTLRTDSAADPLDVAKPHGFSIVTLWSLSSSGHLAPSAMDFVIRYDQTAVDQSAGTYSLIGYQGVSWTVAANVLFNSTDHLATGTFGGSVQYLAIGYVYTGTSSTFNPVRDVQKASPTPSAPSTAVTPEPTTLLVIGAGAIALRRRRRI